MAKFKLPQLTTAQRTGLVLDAREIVYDTDLNVLYYGDGTTSGGLSLVGPAGPQGPPGTLTAVVDDLTPQLGGFLDPFGQFIGMDKGGDIASASPLVIGTDGDYFDVTGTTGFAVMTVAANRFFMLQFDAVLTITNSGSISIPGGANFTTAVGDQLLCFSTVIDTIRILGVTKADGTPVAIELSADSSPQLNGFLDPNGNYIGSDKGGDLASAASMVIGVDGDYFDVTGTTGFADFVVTNNRRFRLQFDDALTITVGSGIVLNNSGANFTTAAGDVIDFQSIAENMVVGSITKADGTSPVTVAGGAWNLIGTVVASGSASLTITGLNSAYDTYAIAVTDMVPVNDNSNLGVRVGDSSGIDSGASDYSFHSQSVNGATTTYAAGANLTATSIEINGSQGSGNAAGEGVGAMLFLHRPGDGTTKPMISGTSTLAKDDGALRGGAVVGMRNAVITLDRINVSFVGGGNISTGRLTVWGIAHA